ncbi:N-acetyl-alpha-D-glucosaminyl L-malate synthase [compost metagenome]
MPSESESFGLAALEALACKVPIITTNAGGLPELNIDGYCGYMSNVGDVDDMAKNTISILEDDAVLKRFKEHAYLRAQDFDLKKILPMYIDFYNEILEQALVEEN